MSKVFPSIKAAAIADTPAGSIVSFQRSGRLLHAIVTDQTLNESRSLVILNLAMQDRPAVTYIENWRNPESVLTYCDSRFEISLDQNKIDPLGQNSWETAGTLLAIDDQVYIRAYHDTTFGDYKLINVESGAVYSGRQTNRFWSFLTWKIWIRDPTSKCDTMLLEFDVSQSRQSTARRAD